MLLLGRKTDMSGMKRGWGQPRTQGVNLIKPESQKGVPELMPFCNVSSFHML